MEKCTFPMKSNCSECPIETCSGKKGTPKPLAQYLDEYIEHEIERDGTHNHIGVKLLFAYGSWRELLEQALDAYESTENVKITIIKKKVR